MFCTYAHYKPQGGLFYIGKGKPRRAVSMDTRNDHWQNVVNKYGKPVVKILAHWDTEEEALDHEKLLIACFRDMGVGIVNKSEGGEGTSGFKFAPHQLENLSKAHLGQKAWNKGLKGVQVAWNKGMPMHRSAIEAAIVKVSCIKCRTAGSLSGITRWHFNGCIGQRNYKARVTINGKRQSIGMFATKEEANQAKINYLKEHA